MQRVVPHRVQFWGKAVYALFDRITLPQFAFVACLLLALALAFFTNDWPTALAIALAGLALGFALRAANRPDGDRSAELAEEELADLRTAQELQAAEIADLREAVDELAGVMESVAADMLQSRSHAVEPQLSAELEARLVALQDEIGRLQGPDAALSDRIDGLERALNSLAEHRETDAADAPVPGTAGLSRLGRLRSGLRQDVSAVLPGMGRARTPQRSASTIRFRPLFEADAERPSGFIVDARIDGSPGSLAPVLREARASIRQFPAAVHLLRVPHVGFDILQEVAEGKIEPDGVLDRLLFLVPQAAIAKGVPAAFDTAREFGAGLALERITDWSLDLRSLASAGLRYIVVDGPAMAHSAAEQRGDPKRLKQVLSARGLGLVADRIASTDELAAVRALLPDLIGGPALAEARTLEEAT